MSAEIWRSEVLTYGFMILNLLATATALLWAHRRGLLGGSDDPATASVELPRGIRGKENGNG